MLLVVPLKAPTIISADRTEATKVLLKWEYLNMEDLGESLMSYEIVYYDLLEEQCPAKTNRLTGNKTKSVTWEDVCAVITNLEPRLKYCVGVAAKTGAGIGEFSYTTIPLYTNSVFTVGFEKCTQGILETPLVNMVQEITKGINQFCHCQFTSEYIGDGRVVCDQEACHRAVFHGKIISINDKNSTELLKDLKKWVSSKPIAVVQGEQVQVVGGETEPSLNCDEQEERDTSSATAGSIVAVILVLLCIITAAVFGVIYYKWRLTKKRSGFPRIVREITSHGMAATNPTSPAGDDVELKDLPNPLYDQHTTVLSTPAEYEVPHQPAEQHEALANPTYGMAEPREPDEEPVLMPMHGLTSPQHSTLNVPIDHVYSEVSAEQDGHIYDVAASD